MVIMKNILLVFEHSIEFDFIRVVLSTLGFNTLSLHKSPEVRSKLKKSAPDLVVTAALATDDEILSELIASREKNGTPKFIWVGTQKQHKKLSPAQMGLIDGMLPTPIQPDKLIEAVCTLLGVSAEEHVQKYHTLQAKMAGQDTKVQNIQNKAPVTADKKDHIFVSDKERKNRFAEVLTRVENLDRVLNVKELNKNQPPINEQANSADLLEKKKNFVKALFGKK